MWKHALNNLGTRQHFHEPVVDVVLWKAIGMRSSCFVSSGLCEVHLMYTDVAFRNHETLDFKPAETFYLKKKYVQFLLYEVISRCLYQSSFCRNSLHQKVLKLYESSSCWFVFSHPRPHTHTYIDKWCPVLYFSTMNSLQVQYE